MTHTQTHDPSASIYRVDRFVVPEAARAEFLSKIQLTHELLRTLPGFRQDMILEKPAEDGALTVMTLVEWESAQAIENARAAVAALHAEVGFDARATMARLGITVELGSYTPVGI